MNNNTTTNKFQIDHPKNAKENDVNDNDHDDDYSRTMKKINFKILIALNIYME